ncbi:RhuM family protein [Chryseobacterium indoltheticum]|nr:RhuM family protein [Chryseobacterium indoltheticum]
MDEEIQKFLIYNTPNEKVRVDVFLQNETLWLTQKALATLFGVAKSTVSEHLTNIFNTEELSRDATVREFRTVQIEGERNVARNLEYYNLDAIISVGYRVNSSKATQFRIWATQTLKEFIIKGFVIDDERLKQGQNVFGKDYFKELLQRIRSIRASERRVYQQITDIFAECSIDYDRNSDITKNFYAIVQNKFHFAINGKNCGRNYLSKCRQ